MTKDKCGSSKDSCGAQTLDSRVGALALKNRLDQAANTQDVKVTLCISGGMPGERVEEEIQLLGTGLVSFKSSDMLRKAEQESASGEIDADEMRELLAKVAEGSEGLLTRTQARFLPDSVIGKLTIEVGEQKTDLFFLPDEGERNIQNKSISPQAVEIIGQLRAFQSRLKGKEKGGKHA